MQGRYGLVISSINLPVAAVGLNNKSSVGFVERFKRDSRESKIIKRQKDTPRRLCPSWVKCTGLVCKMEKAIRERRIVDPDVHGTHYFNNFVHHTRPFSLFGSAEQRISMTKQSLHYLLHEGAGGMYQIITCNLQKRARQVRNSTIKLCCSNVNVVVNNSE